VIRFLVLLALIWLVRRAIRQLLVTSRPHSAMPPEPHWDPHAVLGVAPGASRDVITRSYHDQLKRYHPDRVADLGEELQALAHRKTIELRRAYDELTR
jgi:DnaJ-domain-containing protein 1